MNPTARAAGRAAYTARTSQPDPCTPCPECRGLECLCRPRFFAGQLLTEADLNRLDQYIVAKNRLHNRYVHGWGVVCGLEVVCHPCGQQIVEKAGYALSPCGDDIILCNEVPVDVCQLITGCCEPEPDDCFPPRPRPPACDEVRQQWILAVCYDEQLSRSVPTLKASNGCSPKCGCGGHGGCSCGKSGKQTTSSATRSLRPPPVQCEPTAVCESYRFVAYPAPAAGRELERGAMFDRFLACLAKLTEKIPPLPPANNLTVAALQAWCAQLRCVLAEHFRESPGTNCALRDSLSVSCPPASSDITPQQYLIVIAQQLAPILVEYLRGCLCSALLPPCPEPALSNCVPLATLTIQRKDCKILQVCNLEGRKFLTTFPNLQYWLSWLPYVRNLRTALERICCRIIPQRADPITPGVKPSFNRLRMTDTPASAQSANLSSIAASAFSRRTSAGPKGIEAVAYASMGLNDAKGTPFLKDVDLANPLAVAMVDDLLAPVLADVFPAEALAAFANLGGDAAAGNVVRERGQDQQLKNLSAQIDELQQTVTRQQMTIDGLIRTIRKESGKEPTP